jgi:hypothetical protein
MQSHYGPQPLIELNESAIVTGAFALQRLTQQGLKVRNETCRVNGVG